MYPDETEDFYIRDDRSKVLTARIDMEPYLQLYYLLYRKPKLETLIAEKAKDLARIQSLDLDDVIHDALLILADEHDVDIPQYPIVTGEQMRWEIAWNKLRKYEWEKQRGTLI